MRNTERALMSIQTLFNKYARNERKRSNLAKDSGHQIEFQAREMSRETLFQLRLEVERKLDKLGLNRFCSLSAFSKKTRELIEEKK